MEWQTIKTSQGNVGRHWSEKNVLVHTSIGLHVGSANPPIEFEITRNMHLKDIRAPFTVTAMLKDPPTRLIAEAWRILLHATEKKQLFSTQVQEYWKSRCTCRRSPRKNMQLLLR